MPPTIITAYFTAQAGNDIEALVSCFTDDAVITDDGKTVAGKEAIRVWKQEVDTAFEYSTDIVRTDPAGDGNYAVTAEISGNFPGSPVRLQYRFALSGELISELVIAP